MSAGFDLPSPVATARFLAQFGAELGRFDGTSDNCERWALAQAAEFLSFEPPNCAAALESAEEGCEHAFRGTFVEDRCEAWLCVAVVELLRGAQ